MDVETALALLPNLKDNVPTADVDVTNVSYGLPCKTPDAGSVD
jgi:hypothetical protein